MSPRRAEFPRERKVTARFTVEEVELLTAEADRRGEPVSSLVRKLVVTTIDEVQGKLEGDEGT